jgi:hypothetical protein
MKKRFSLFSFIFLFACFLMPVVLIMDMNYGLTSGIWILVLWVFLPFSGIICAFVGEKGSVKKIGVILNGVTFCLLLYVVLGRTVFRIILH